MTVSYYEWIQNKRMERWTEAEVNSRLEHAMKRNYRIIRDIQRNNPRKTDMHDSRPFCVGKPYGGRELEACRPRESGGVMKSAAYCGNFMSIPSHH